MSKSKSPAFSFYAADWLSDTQHMTPAENGAYIRLVATAWRGTAGLPQCFIPADDGRLARIVGMSDSEWSGSRSAVLELFQLDEDRGAYFHGRLLKELARQNERSASARTSAERRWGARRSAATPEAETTKRPSKRSASLPPTARQGYSPSTAPSGLEDLEKAKQTAIATVRAYGSIPRETKAAALFDIRSSGSVAEVDACLRTVRQQELRGQIETQSIPGAPSEA